MEVHAAATDHRFPVLSNRPGQHLSDLGDGLLLTPWVPERGTKLLWGASRWGCSGSQCVHTGACSVGSAGRRTSIVSVWARLSRLVFVNERIDIKCIYARCALLVQSSIMSEKSAIHGKAFEYAVLAAIRDRVQQGFPVVITSSKALSVAEIAFGSLLPADQGAFTAAARAGVMMLFDREPRLEHSMSAQGELYLCLQSDQKGQSGDVRDIIMRRPAEGWEIGVSAKNNHKA